MVTWLKNLFNEKSENCCITWCENKRDVDGEDSCSSCLTMMNPHWEEDKKKGNKFDKTKLSVIQCQEGPSQHMIRFCYGDIPKGWKKLEDQSMVEDLFKEQT